MIKVIINNLLEILYFRNLFNETTHTFFIYVIKYNFHEYSDSQAF